MCVCLSQSLCSSQCVCAPFTVCVYLTLSVCVAVCVFLSFSVCVTLSVLHSMAWRAYLLWMPTPGDVDLADWWGLGCEQDAARAGG